MIIYRRTDKIVTLSRLTAKSLKSLSNQFTEMYKRTLHKIFKSARKLTIVRCYKQIVFFNRY